MPQSKPSKLYTKTGDRGQTALLTGQRLSKASLVFEILGTLDEFNASLGLVVAVYQEQFLRSLAVKKGRQKAVAAQYTLARQQKDFLLQLQRSLFDVGAEIAGSKKPLLPAKFLAEMEKEIDAIQAMLAQSWRQRFVLPGGSLLAAQLDISRTVCRRLERLLVKLEQEQDIRNELLQLINRCSDYLYALRSLVNWALKVKEVEY